MSEMKNDNINGNDRIAPTNENTTKELEKQIKGANAAFVSLIKQHYKLYGYMPDAVEAKNEYDISHEDFANYLKEPLVLQMLQAEGIVKDFYTSQTLLEKINGHSIGWLDGILTPLQLKVADVMLDLIDNRSQKKKLQDLGVSTTQYNTWLKDDNFKKYMALRAKSMKEEQAYEADLALMDKIRMGDMKAIQLHYEMTGQYSPGSARADAQMVDFQNLLVNILEIVTDEIDDPAVGARIADRFRDLVGARTLASELATGTVIKPEIAENRELTPRLKGLME